MTTLLAFPSTSLMELWSIYNHEESLFPFYVPLMLWSGAYIYCKLPPSSSSSIKNPPLFHKLLWLHNIHNIGTIVIGLISLYINDDRFFHERISILWNLSYFTVDILDTVLRGDVAFTVHAVFCLILGTCNLRGRILQQIRANSKASLYECSSPFLHYAKITRKPEHFALFGLVFTLCRIIWIPMMIKELIASGLPWYDLSPACLTGFYCLNLFWYYKIIRIVMDGASKKHQGVEKKKEM